MNTATLVNLSNQEFVQEVAITWQKSKVGDTYDNALDDIFDQITPLAALRGISFEWIGSYNRYCNQIALGLPGLELIELICSEALSELKKVGVAPNPEYHHQKVWSNKYEFGSMVG